MPYDAQLYLRASSVSGSFYLTNGLIPVPESTAPILLPGTPLRGLNCNIRMTTMTPTASASLVFALMEGASTGATHYVFRQFPNQIDSTNWRGGDVNLRFHLDKGYPSLKAWYTMSFPATAGGVGSLDIRVGMDKGAYGNG